MSSAVLRLLFLVAWLNRFSSFANQATIQEIPHKLVRFPLVGIQNTTIENATIGIGKPLISVVELNGIEMKETEGTTEQILLQTLIKMDTELRGIQNYAPKKNSISFLITFITVFILNT